MGEKFNEGNIFKGSPEVQKALSEVDIKNLIPNNNLSSASIKRSNSAKEIQQAMADTYARKAQYEADLLNTLRSIESNTANLGEIVGLIQNSNTQQEEMIDLLSEIMSIAKASNREEAEKMWQKIMSKITSTVDGVDSVTKLLGFGTIVFNQVIQNMDKIIK